MRVEEDEHFICTSQFERLLHQFMVQLQEALGLSELLGVLCSAATKCQADVDTLTRQGGVKAYSNS